MTDTPFRHFAEPCCAAVPALSNERGGANTLCLAIGLLCWTEAEKAESVYLAPILLIPVWLQGQSVCNGLRLTRHDDGAIVDPTVLQLLKRNVGLRVAGLEAIPTDDNGVGANKVLQAFRLAFREIPKWGVKEEVHLGNCTGHAGSSTCKSPWVISARSSPN